MQEKITPIFGYSKNDTNDYLHWLINNVELKGGLKFAVCKKLNVDVDVLDILREEINSLKQQQVIDNSNDKITKVYREFAMKYHPDRGGDDAIMGIINDIFDRLRS
jgi:hypothetical protein